ncbi:MULTISPECIES: recombinase family protein [unclassified Rhizobium]|uniref:recombinase family protein n=1 Tax=unclassified Rhizobium TaxID=2613769 RepID=UPI001ADAB638|nr:MULTISPECIES: recombinase family protein [unclassified Rhizobium]MBO9099385.1 recombinase family protein [Rhizobium sp. L58/93]QXZ82353.1 recombinase family protein [Rhizobium sp. K1/93]QXZ90134.1 recombinase family protein [Rhizobium sp. K15/93]QYA02671.1 recombinase family protein [Rhizobium sp. B21/90]
MTFVRAYLRASTKDQDANRAKDDLIKFARERSMRIASFYAENESGASLKRPELFRLLNDCEAGDILLVEQIDRLSRLNSNDWDSLKTQIHEKRVKVVSLDLPTSWILAKADADDIQTRILEAINGMMLDMLAAIARKDYVDRNRRQAQGIEKAKLDGVYKGRPENKARNAAIRKMLASGQSWNSVIAATGASRSTLAKLAKPVPDQ